MITIKEVLNKSEAFLSEKGMKSPRREAEEILSVALSKPRIDLYMEFDRPLSNDELDKARQILKRRASHEPMQYIQGYVSFFNAHIKVNTSVLIPRQETELLAEKIASQLNGKSLDNKVLWDVCTGSGALAISLKKAFPNLTVIASDLSEKALQVAKQNAEDNQVEIQFKQGDLLEPFKHLKVDYLVCNPPYIPENELGILDMEVRGFEPLMSLVSGPSGLEMYERLAKELKQILKTPSKGWFEIGYNQGNSVKQIFESAGFDNVCFEKDLSGKDRFFFLELE